MRYPIITQEICDAIFQSLEIRKGQQVDIAKALRLSQPIISRIKSCGYDLKAYKRMVTKQLDKLNRKPKSGIKRFIDAVKFWWYYS